MTISEKAVEAAQFCDPFKHDYREEYYGYRCTKCPSFVPFGCEPWIDEGGDDAE